jgi:hypothetical protein
MSQDHSYFAARAIEERRLAMAASDPSVRRVHLEMAARYALQAGPKANPIHDSEDERRSA